MIPQITFEVGLVGHVFMFWRALYLEKCVVLHPARKSKPQMYINCAQDCQAGQHDG